MFEFPQQVVLLDLLHLLGFEDLVALPRDSAFVKLLGAVVTGLELLEVVQGHLLGNRTVEPQVTL